jgi:hypothetical protein
MAMQRKLTLGGNYDQTMAGSAAVDTALRCMDGAKKVDDSYAS